MQLKLNNTSKFFLKSFVFLLLASSLLSFTKVHFDQKPHNSYSTSNINAPWEFIGFADEQHDILVYVDSDDESMVVKATIISLGGTGWRDASGTVSIVGSDYYVTDLTIPSANYSQSGTHILYQ